MSTELTGTAHPIWRNATDQQARIEEMRRRMAEGDRVINRIIENYRELPSIEDLHAQANTTNALITAAQAYRRDLLKLLALAGGYRRDINAQRRADQEVQAEFDAWHQAELRKARAEALREAADMLYEYQWPPGCGKPMGSPDEQAGWMHGADDAHELFDRLLRDRADRIEEA